MLLLASTLPVAGEPCESLVERPPTDPLSCECLRDFTAKASALYDERLTAWLELGPLDPWLQAAVGARNLERDPPRARAALESALTSFVASGRGDGEAYVRLLRARDAQRRRKIDDVRSELAAAEPLVVAADDPVLTAWQAQIESSELSFASRYEASLSTARTVVLEESFAALPRTLRYHLLIKAETSARFAERYSEALAFGRRVGELCEGSPGCRAEYLDGVASTLRHMAADGLASHGDAVRATGEAYAAAVATGKTWSALDSACEMGSMTDAEASIEWNRRCAEFAETLRCPDLRINARLRLAEGLALTDPSRVAEAIRTVEGLIVEARRYSTTLDPAGGHATLARLHELAGQRTEAIAALETAIETRERIRDRQADPASRANVLARSARYYYRLAANLALTREGADVERAFATMEALRGRTMLDLRASPTGPESADGGGPDGAQLAQTVEHITAVQARLADPAATPGECDLLLGELDRLEAAEAELTSRIGRANPNWAEARRPRVATLDEVRQRLGGDEAVILLQLPSMEVADAWALVITDEDERVVRLTAFDAARAASLYLGAIARRTEVPPGMGTALHQMLFAPVLEALPPDVRRLVIVPDGAVARLPIAALTDPGTGRSLVERFELSFVPSATSWLALRDSGDGRLADGALGFGNVNWNPGRTSPDAARDSWSADTRGALPRSGDEVRAMVEAVRGESRALYGSLASEASLKQLDLTPFGIIHFATHAVVNEAHPSRSAILLTPGNVDEDGLLQPREIARLQLDGKLVVLSACGSADGRDLKGEGPISLARAFLEAGARAVVGTIWPVRDGEAAELAQRFYAHMALGEPAGRALATAQRERLAAGAPAAAWAGFVLIGDGDVALATSTPVSKAARSWIAPATIAVTFAFLALFAGRRLHRRKRDRPSTSP